MRLFVALSLPAPVRAALIAAQERLRLGGHPVRWTDQAGLHLTLQFLGEADPSIARALVACLTELPAAGLRLELGEPGAFPTVRRPRVLWVGVGGDTAALMHLQALVVAATERLGFTSEPRAFTPHITIGRVRPDATPSALRSLGDAIACAAPPPALGWEAGPPLLFQSTLTAKGAIYTQLGP